ncbi:type II secretion system F family protein, partial [Nocardioides sp. CER28]
LAGLAVALLPRARAPVVEPRRTTSVRASAVDGGDWMRRYRLPLSLLAGIATVTLVGGLVGSVAAPFAAAGCWRAIDRAEPAGVRREREELRRELPHLARLLAAALAAGAAPVEAVQAVADALPGPGGARLAGAAARLRLGSSPVAVWEALAQEPALAPLGRALARGQSSGASVVASVERLGDELARAARADAEDRARRVGVKAAVPLGVCLLPSFLLIGIVPLVGGLLSSLRL